MREFDSLTFDEQRDVIAKGKKYLTMVHPHTTISIVNTASKTHAIAPSGSDLFNPALWKDIHWRWFFEQEDKSL